jgi:hypothetical protein
VCSAAPKYVVTEAPIDVGRGILLCVAVDRDDPQGVWWWGPGRDGCQTRSTGPGLFHADDGQVSHVDSRVNVAFRLGLHSLTEQTMIVRLAIDDGQMRAEGSNARVAIVRRANLDDIRELAPFGRTPRQ